MSRVSFIGHHAHNKRGSMSRETGYRVTITGFLSIGDKNDLMLQKKALDYLTGPLDQLVAGLTNVEIEPRMMTREIDEAGNPVPRAPRKPRAARATGRKAA